MDIREPIDEMNRFVEAVGWCTEDSPLPQTPRNVAASLSLEAAEVLEYSRWGETGDPDALAEEPADVALSRLHPAFVGVDLEQAILDRLAVHCSRDWAEE